MNPCWPAAENSSGILLWRPDRPGSTPASGRYADRTDSSGMCTGVGAVPGTVVRAKQSRYAQTHVNPAFQSAQAG